MRKIIFAVIVVYFFISQYDVQIHVTDRPAKTSAGQAASSPDQDEK